MSSTTVVVVPSFSIVLILSCTSVPFISPLSSKSCKEGNFIVALTALIVLEETVWVTGFEVVTVVPITVSASVASIPEIKVWLLEPKRKSKVTFL